jgi:hypothetical protein
MAPDLRGGVVVAQDMKMMFSAKHHINPRRVWDGPPGGARPLHPANQNLAVAEM